MTTGSGLTNSPTFSADVLRRFQSRIQGELLRPGHPEYDAARRIHNGLIDRHPAVIVRCRTRDDVVRALEFARQHELVVAVRAGGHNVAGKALCDDGIVIDVSTMKRIEVDPAARTARAEPGLTWGEFDRATQAHGLATTGGFISTTGIAGLTLGGGLGWLMRSHGLACDNLTAVEIVTADGGVLTASASEHPDLFWAVRGGGGNFGVVTSLEYRLHPIGPLLAGVIFFPLSEAAPALRLYRDLMAQAPDELMAYAVFLTSPEGQRMFAVPVCYLGSPERGAELLRDLRSHPGVVADLVRPMSYLELQTMFDPGFPPGRLNYWKSSFLRGLSDEAIATVVAHFGQVPSAASTIAIEPFGGAVARVAADETAFPHRQAHYSMVIVGMWADPAESAANIRWTRNLWTAMQPFAEPAVYVNYLDADDAERVAAAYRGPTYERLRRVKQRYDPDNFFHVNQNIGPSA
ncbi:MAG TPA: FAD-binding oxidoreductase [Gemmatimonadales bacterium]